MCIIEAESKNTLLIGKISLLNNRVYTGETSKNIFDEVAVAQIDEVLSGYNACIFAYGATGSGKTYTMLGNEKIDGISKLCLKEVFNQIEPLRREMEFTVKVNSFL